MDVGETEYVPVRGRWSVAGYSLLQRWWFLAILFGVSATSYLDRFIISVLLEPIKREFGVSDTMLGLLTGFSFVTFYAAFGLPLAAWADRGNRRTVITVSVAVWSVMTMLCGLAQNFVQLIVARVGVGIGEAGGVPAGQSLLADYFPPEQRARAIGIFMSASTAGNLLGVGLGAYIASRFGWRAAFLLSGVPGIVLTPIARLFLQEPRLREGWSRANAQRGTVWTDLGVLFSKSSYRNALYGTVAFFFLSYGAILFVPTYLVRARGMALTEIGYTYGTMFACGALVGTLLGGYAADRLARRDARWLAWLSAISSLASAPLYLAAFNCSSYGEFLPLMFLALALNSGGLPPIYTAVLSVCGGTRRAIAIASLLFAATIIGGGFGPLLTGYMSDLFSVHAGAQGIRYALSIMTAVPVIAALFFYRCAATLRQEAEV